MSKRKKITYGVIAVLGLIATIAFFVINRSENESIELKTAKTKLADIQNTVTATGTIEASVTVNVGTQVSGKIKQLYADFNSQVKKGQLLAVLDTETLESSLESSKASLNLAQAEYDLQKANYDRNRPLKDSNLIASAEFDEIIYKYRSAKANMSAAQARYRTDKTNLAYAYIYSPIDGVVLERNVEEGETVAASFETPTLFTIANDLTQMEIEAKVDEADIGKLKTGQRVSFSVDAYPDNIFNGKLAEIHLMPSENTNVVTYTVVIKAPNPDNKLMPGMTASVSVYVTDLKKVLTVPNKACEFKPDFALLNNYKQSHPELKIESPGSFTPTTRPPFENVGHKTPHGNASLNTNDQVSRENHHFPQSDSHKIVWIVQEDSIGMKMIEVGETDETNYQVISGITEGEIVLVGLSSANENIETLSTMPSDNRSGSPFMPRPPRR